MTKLLINCYFDGMTVKEATDFISRCYQEVPTQRQINAAMKTIREQTNKSWN